MNICLIGGIYGTRGTPSGYLRVTPETTLENGLRQAGHFVTTMSHYQLADFGQFDVVHVHHLSYGAMRLACDRSSVPFVFTPHDASQMSGLQLSPMRSAAQRFVLSAADRVISLSRVEADFLRANCVDAQRLATIPNGIDTRQFPYCRQNSAGNGRPWQLLFVGQLIPLKRCDVIVRAVAALGPNVELTLVYQTADQEVELKALAAALGMEQRVHFLGRRDPAQLAELYQTCDLLVLASETEALPSVISEAMLSGLPFVSTTVGGIREQAANFGHLIEDRSVHSLASGIGHVLAHYASYQANAEAMSEHARGTYSIPDMVRLHVELYKSVAGERPRRLSWLRAIPNLIARVGVQRFGTRAGAASPPSNPVPALPDHAAPSERS